MLTLLNTPFVNHQKHRAGLHAARHVQQIKDKETSRAVSPIYRSSIKTLVRLTLQGYRPWRYLAASTGIRSICGTSQQHQLQAVTQQSLQQHLACAGLACQTSSSPAKSTGAPQCFIRRCVLLYANGGPTSVSLRPGHPGMHWQQGNNDNTVCTRHTLCRLQPCILSCCALLCCLQANTFVTYCTALTWHFFMLLVSSTGRQLRLCHSQ